MRCLLVVRQQVFGIQDDKANTHQHAGQSQTEGNQEHQPQADTPERNGAEQQHQRGRAGNQPATGSEGDQAPQCNIALMHVTMDVAVAMIVNQHAVCMLVVVLMIRMIVGMGMVVMHVTVLMVVMVVIMCVPVRPRGFQTLEEQESTDPDDRNSGDRAQHGSDFFRQHEL